MSVKKKLGLPAGKLIAIAGLAGLLAGGAAIYVKESLSGNGAVASADPAACAPRYSSHTGRMRSAIA